MVSIVQTLLFDRLSIHNLSFIHILFSYLLFLLSITLISIQLDPAGTSCGQPPSALTKSKIIVPLFSCLSFHFFPSKRRPSRSPLEVGRWNRIPAGRRLRESPWSYAAASPLLRPPPRLFRQFFVHPLFDSPTPSITSLVLRPLVFHLINRTKVFLSALNPLFLASPSVDGVA